MYAVACIALAGLSCGVVAELPTVAPTETIGYITETIVTANVESVNTEIHTYTTTAPLHIRACASVDCAVLAYLAAGDSVVVTVRGISGPGCAGAEWYAVDWQDWTGFVCSIYVEER
jgi:hypothetical protein